LSRSAISRMDVPSKPWSVNKSKATSRILSRVDAPA